MNHIARDLRHALRSLGRSRGFAAIAVLTLALGIGATTAIFTLVDRIALRPLPYPGAERLVWMESPVPGVGEEERWGVSVAGYLYFREHSRTLESVGAFSTRSANLAYGRGTERVKVAGATPSFFDAVRATPAQGKLFSAADGAAGAEPAVVLGHDFWVRNFGADPGVVGSTVKLNSYPVQVVGVMGPGVHLPNEAVDVWMAMPMDPAGPFYNEHSLSVVGRMRGGATHEAVQRELAGLTTRFPAAYPEVYPESFMRETRFSTAVVPLRDHVLGGVDRVLWVLLGSVALVLLIACVNVANLFLVRAAGRRREVALRSALGARRGHLMRGAVAEGTLVALAGGALGALLAGVAVRSLVRLAPAGVPRLGEVALDARGVAVALVLALAAGVVMGVFPLLRAPVNFGILREGGRGQTASRGEHALRGALVTGQMAVALVLLAAAGLMLRSFDRLRSVDPGFDPAGVTVMELSLPRQGYEDYAKVTRFYRTLAERVAALPGVASVGAVDRLPMQDAGCASLFVEGRPVVDISRAPCVAMAVAAPGYFRTMGIPVQGRATEWDETERGTEGVVVTHALAQRLWPGENPMGKGLRGNGDEPPYFRVVGVTGDLRAEGLDKAPAEMVFYPMNAAKGLTLWSPPRTMRLMVKTRSGPAPLAEVRRVLRQIDAEVPIGQVQSMDEVVAASPSVARVTFTLMLLGAGAAMALLLSVVGLYGVISYTVAQRTSEMGIRMALGARTVDVTRLVVRESLRLVGMGVVLGVVLAVAATRALRALLFEVAPGDPLTLAGVSALLVVVALLASWLPARRAARVDPMTALRAE